MKLRNVLFFNLSIFWLSGMGATAQVWLKALPLESTREDIIAMQTGERRLSDGSSYFDLDKEAITVKYYKDSCGTSSGGHPIFASDLVVQIRSDLKDRQSIGTLVGASVNLYEKIELHDGQFAYIDHKHGFVVVSRQDGDSPEVVKSLYYIPKTVQLSGCLLKLMDDPIRTAFSKSHKWAANEQTDFYSHISFNYPKLTSSDTKTLELFAKSLGKSDMSSGFIYVYAKADQSLNRSEFWIDKLQKYLVEELGIEPKRFQIINAGVQEREVALLLVVRKGSNSKSANKQ